jgi:hypothetical protein
VAVVRGHLLKLFLSQADKRLMPAVRMLATLRGVKPAEVLGQVPALPLPMV